MINVNPMSLFVKDGIALAASGKIAKIPFSVDSSLAYVLNRKKLETLADHEGVAVTWEGWGALLVKK